MTHYIAVYPQNTSLNCSPKQRTHQLFSCAFKWNKLLKDIFIFVYSILFKWYEYTLRWDLSTPFAKAQERENPRIQRYSLIIWTYDDDGPRSLGTWVWILWLCHRMIRGHWLDFSGSQLFICYLDEMTSWPMSPLDDDYYFRTSLIR